jgi:hypothetical protein
LGLANPGVLVHWRIGSRHYDHIRILRSERSIQEERLFEFLPSRTLSLVLLSLGMLGMHGTPCANLAVQNADLLIHDAQYIIPPW